MFLEHSKSKKVTNSQLEFEFLLILSHIIILYYQIFFYRLHPLTYLTISRVLHNFYTWKRIIANSVTYLYTTIRLFSQTSSTHISYNQQNPSQFLLGKDEDHKSYIFFFFAFLGQKSVYFYKINHDNILRELCFRSQSILFTQNLQ